MRMSRVFTPGRSNIFVLCAITQNENHHEVNDTRLTVEEKAKTVMSVCSCGTLCTISICKDISGAPFGSFVDFILDDEGNPVLLMNKMSMHTVNIAVNIHGFVTLFAQFGGKINRNTQLGQNISRCSITGVIEKINSKNEKDFEKVRMRYSISHGYADQVMDSPKFAFYRLRPVKVYFVGGFGILAKWLSLDKYRKAAPDILAQEAPDIVAKLNRDHKEDLYLTSTHLLDCKNIEHTQVSNIDRLGIDIRVTTKREKNLNTDVFRIGFRVHVMSVEDAKSEVMKVFQEAWEKANEYRWGYENVEPGSDIPVMKIASDSLQ